MLSKLLSMTVRHFPVTPIGHLERVASRQALRVPSGQCDSELEGLRYRLRAWDSLRWQTRLAYATIATMLFGMAASLLLPTPTEAFVALIPAGIAATAAFCWLDALRSRVAVAALRAGHPARPSDPRLLRGTRAARRE